MAILVGAERYDAAMALEDDIRRGGHYTDPLRYQLAFAAIQTGEFDLAEALIELLQSK